MINVRRALSADSNFVIAAAKRLADFGPPTWRPPEEIVSGETRTLESFFADPLSGAALLIAESADGKKLGFAYLERQEDYFTREPHGHVGMLVVIQEGEGRGVGSALMRAAEGWAREQRHRKLTLTVFEGNRAARAVYEHLGYAPETLRYVKIL